MKIYNGKGNIYETEEHLPCVAVCHRGVATASVRENTMPAFKKAAELGYNGIETDVRKTHDGVYVLNHDATLSAGGSTYTISSTNYSTLKAAAADLCTLDEYLLFCKKNGICAILDMKVQEAAMAAHAVAHGMGGMTWYNINANADVIEGILAEDAKACFHVQMNAEGDYEQYLAHTQLDRLVLTVDGDDLSALSAEIAAERAKGVDVYVWAEDADNIAASLALCPDWHEPTTEYGAAFMAALQSWVKG